MAKVPFNYKEYREKTKDGPKAFDMPPPGSDVVCVIRKDGTEEKTSHKGNRYMQIKMEVISPTGKGYYLWYSVPDGEYQMSFLGRLLEAAGIDVRKITEVDYNKLIGKKLRARVKHEVRSGNTRAVINYFLPYNAQIEGMEDAGPATVSDPNPPNGGEGNNAEAPADDLPF